MALLSQNKKMKASSNGEFLVYNFGIPAYKSKTGQVTCPFADECIKGCYANQGAYLWSNVAQAYEKRLASTLTDEFVHDMSAEISKAVASAARKDKLLLIRIHDSGDFYSSAYLAKWLEIIAAFPMVKFYAYTKSIPLFEKVTVPSNFKVIYSYGGKLDKLINTTKHYHAKVFTSSEALTTSNYVDGMGDDLVAAVGDTKRIGLVYHGAKSKTWEA
jgi:hypothetical protein